MIRLSRAHFLTAFSLGIMVSVIYLTRVEVPNLAMRMSEHDQILQHTALSPFRYRVLVPFLAEAIAALLRMVGASRENAFVGAFFFFNVAAFSGLLLSAGKLLRQFFSSDRTLIGMLVIGGLIHIMLQAHTYQPWTALESLLFNLALLAMLFPAQGARQVLVLAGLIFIATLNRETGLAIPGTLLIYTLLEGRDGLRGRLVKQAPAIATCLLVWLVTYAALRLSLGDAPHQVGLGQLWVQNVSAKGFSGLLVNGFLMLGLLWSAFVAGLRRADPRLKRLLIAGTVVYLPLIAVFGVWLEVRLWMPLYGLIVAMVLSGLEPDRA